jgi:hypothetical protein
MSIDISRQTSKDLFEMSHRQMLESHDKFMAQYKIEGSDQYRKTPFEMHDVWQWSLACLIRKPKDIGLRLKQCTLVNNIKSRLIVPDKPHLYHMYCMDSRWCQAVAQETFPNDWAQITVHYPTAAAYGLRFIELNYGREITAQYPPDKFVGEWTV